MSMPAMPYFRALLDNVAPPPCDRGEGCPQRARCAELKLACKRFAFYVEPPERWRGVRVNGRIKWQLVYGSLLKRHPTRRQFDRIYDRGDDSQIGRPRAVGRPRTFA